MKILLYILISFTTSFSYCKDYAGFPLWRGSGGGHASNPLPTQEDTLIYTDFDEPAQFPGGNAAMKNHLLDSLIYVPTEYDEVPEGFFVKFVVEKDGSLTHIAITRSSGVNGFDEAIVQRIACMPKWIPAKNQDKIVRSEFLLPVHICFK